LLQRELETHRMVIESVTKGLDGLLKRIAQRLEVLGREAPAEAPAGAQGEAAPEAPVRAAGE
jgi:hypothetical protein